MINDFFVIFYWWIILSGLGVAFLPLTFRLFPKFFDKGYAFSKIIGVLIVSYVVWLLGSLKILQFVPEAVWLVVIGTVAINLFLLREKRERFAKDAKRIWKIILLEELLFFVSLASWAFIRGFQPDIHGLEKFMDFGFVNSILRSKYFPPADMWLAGKTINYYYFGHLVTAVLTKLSGLDSALTYNLMVAAIFALTFTGAFSLGGNLLNSKFQISNFKQISNIKYQIPKTLAAGLLTAFLLTLAGNLHPLYWFLKNHNFRTYWYPDATRFIVEQFGAADNTIHEFPAYSWVVADLHGHMINIPTVLLMLALIFYIRKELGSKKSLRNLLSQLSILVLCLATAFMTNAWDLPIYLLVAGGVFLLGKGWKRALTMCCALGAVSYVLTLPFHLNFQNIAQGVALTDFHSPPWMFLVLWGFPLFITASYLTRKKRNNFILVLLAVGWLLILVPEIIYIKDIYIHSYQRANTMFKLTYQSFIMFSLAGGYIIVKILSNLKKNLFHFAYAVSLFVLLIFVFIYPFYAVKSYYGLKNYQGLNGLQWLGQQYPDDSEAVVWLKENIKGQPVILEAVGESYTDFARVSANTGLPTVCGWTVHEWLWRGSYDEPGERDGEVRRIYESADAKDVRALLKKYKVEYIYLGSLERQKYPLLDEEKFAKMGEVAFENEGTKIYHLSKDFN